MQLITYLTFTGDCEQALTFYKERLNGEILEISRMGDTKEMEIPDDLKSKIMHARLKVGENEVFMSDTFDASQINKGNNMSLTLVMDDVDKTEKLFNALSDGGKVTMPLQDTFWGARFGMLVDKFGIPWMLNCEKKS
jgi:PhnB protein